MDPIFQPKKSANRRREEPMSEAKPYDIAAPSLGSFQECDDLQTVIRHGLLGYSRGMFDPTKPNHSIRVERFSSSTTRSAEGIAELYDLFRGLDRRIASFDKKIDCVFRANED